MSIKVLQYQALFWLLMAITYFLFGGWGLVGAAFVAYAGASELRRSDLWFFQVLSIGAGALVVLSWPELSQLLQETVNEAWGWHLDMSPLALGGLGGAALLGALVLSVAVPEWRKQSQYGC